MKINLLPIPSLFFTLSLIGLTSLNSCKPEKEDVSPAIETSCLLTSVYDTNPLEYADSTNYRYDIQGRLLQSTWYYSGRERGVIDNEYNSQGKLVKLISNEKYTDPQQQIKIEITDVLTYEYNDKGQVVKSTSARTTPKTGNYSRSPIESVFEYDNEGNCTKVTKMYANQTNITEYTYEGGNCIKAVNGPGGFYEVVTVFEYDLSKEDKLQTFNQSFVLTENTANKNLLKKSIRTLTQNPAYLHTIQEYTYEYDEQGNVIKVEVNVETATHVKSTYNIFKKYTCR